MKLYRIIALAFALTLLAACTSAQIIPDKISTTPAAGSLPIPITDAKAVTDLEGAASNFDKAVAIGALSATDPAPSCLHDALRKAGIELPPGAVAPQSFTPVSAGPFSEGATLYILAQQIKSSLGAGITISQECYALVGKIHLDFLMATAKGAKGALGLSGLGTFGVTGGAIVPGVGLVKP